ncbi:MAG: PASTA domain-containing protein [Candidatus Cloacimonetes bacterium]|nr:PASTA domain-containing protein [Candidatus Cloacimonadota bacterium]
MEKSKKIKKYIPSIAAFGILIILFIVGFFGTNIFMKIIVGHRNEVKVPDLTGVDFNVARKKCKDHKLYLKQSDLIHNDEIEKGKIIAQAPHPDIMIKKYRTISVVVSNGAEMVRIPYLDNLTIVEARLKLENAGLMLGKKIYRYSDDVMKDKIIFSQPMADELIAKKEKIDVIVSLGKLPDVSDKKNKYKYLLDKLPD